MNDSIAILDGCSGGRTRSDTDHQPAYAQCSARWPCYASRRVQRVADALRGSYESGELIASASRPLTSRAWHDHVRAELRHLHHCPLHLGNPIVGRMCSLLIMLWTTVPAAPAPGMVSHTLESIDDCKTDWWLVESSPRSVTHRSKQAAPGPASNHICGSTRSRNGLFKHITS